MKNFLLALLIGLSVTGLFMQYANKVQSDLSENILRLHIVANSNRPQDQELKIKVRDRIVAYLSDKVADNFDLQQTKALIQDNLEGIKQVAEEEITKEGFSYPVETQVGTFAFPTKYYENFALPRGNYEALRVAIGDGSGQNWWCVLYPNLCFVNGMVAMPQSSRSKLDNVLTEDEISLISDTRQFPVKIKFKLVEFFSNLHISSDFAKNIY